jgi:hypothetical protein
MADKTKLMFSDGELRFVKDTSWVLTKHKIIQTVYGLFNEQVKVIKEEWGTVLNGDLAQLSAAVPKISKGENYQSLPYVILDFPAVFGKQNIFALRTMFWWGKFVTITLHLSGKYADNLRQRITEKLQADPAGIFICVNSSQWEHHLEPDNYSPAAAIPADALRQILQNPVFIKLALRYELEEWNGLPVRLRDGYRKLTEFIAP